ncbi:MAG: peptidylprolyl isomerase, partial [Bacteroidota bacterium]|nr:peptidylprolyl isomerase [Bacteroidota bacterium]
FYIVQGRTHQPADLDRIEERNARSGIDRKFSEAEKEVYGTLGGAPHLDGGYTVFGQVVEGMEVVDEIAKLPTDARDRPLQDVRMYMKLK